MSADQFSDNVKRTDGAKVLVSSMFGIGTGVLVLGNYAVGAFVYPLNAAFGWPRSYIIFAYSVTTLVTLVTGPLAGWMVDRFPVRRLVIASQITFGLSFMLIGWLANENIERFYVLHIIMAVLAMGSLPVTFNAIVSRTFTKNRGLALGVMLSSTGLCGVIVPPFLSLLITHFGWRCGYVGLGLVPVAGALFLSCPFLPQIRNERASQDGEIVLGVSLGTAMRDRRLWTLAISLLIGAGLSTAVVANFIPMLRDRGASPLVASGALSVFGIAVIAGRLLIGAMVDRIWAPLAATIVIVPAAVALSVLALAGANILIAYGCAAVLGLAAGAEGDMLAFLGVRYFGLAQAGKIYAFIYFFFSVGIVVGAPVFAAVHDRVGTYQPALIGGAAVWLICAALLLSLGRYPDLEVPESHSGQ